MLIWLGIKDNEYLVRAVPLVLAKIPTARFFIVGGGELMDKLQDSIRLHGIKRRKLFLPDFAEMWAPFTRSRIFSL